MRNHKCYFRNKINSWQENHLEMWISSMLEHLCVEPWVWFLAVGKNPMTKALPSIEDWGRTEPPSPEGDRHAPPQQLISCGEGGMQDNPGKFGMTNTRVASKYRQMPSYPNPAKNCFWLPQGMTRGHLLKTHVEIPPQSHVQKSRGGTGCLHWSVTC